MASRKGKLSSMQLPLRKSIEKEEKVILPVEKSFASPHPLFPVIKLLNCVLARPIDKTGASRDRKAYAGRKLCHDTKKARRGPVAGAG